MQLQEEHWHKLFSNITTEGNSWYGIWNSYSASKEIIKSAKGIRILSANHEQTVITHTNQFPSADGTVMEKSWQIDKETCNLTDGLCHPADTSKRALSLLGYGSSAWLPKKLESGKGFSVELFLKQGDYNTSIGSIYDQNGNLEKILHLQEHLGSFIEIQTPEIETLPGNWHGKKQSINPNLEVSEIEEITTLVLDPTGGKNKTFFLPDGVVVNIPETIKLAEEFEIIAGKLMTNNEYQRLTAKYDNYGNFTLLISEVFHLK